MEPTFHFLHLSFNVRLRCCTWRSPGGFKAEYCITNVLKHPPFHPYLIYWKMKGRGTCLSNCLFLDGCIWKDKQNESVLYQLTDFCFVLQHAVPRTSNFLSFREEIVIFISCENTAIRFFLAFKSELSGGSWGKFPRAFFLLYSIHQVIKCSESKEKQCEISPPTVIKSSKLVSCIHISFKSKSVGLWNWILNRVEQIVSKCSPMGPPVIFTSAIFFLIQKQLSQDVKAFSGYSLSLITCELHMNSDLSKVVVSKVSYLRSWSGSVCWCICLMVEFYSTS